jgi:hypothetical protein
MNTRNNKQEYSIPITDSNGNIDHYRPCSHDEYVAWANQYEKR